MRREAPDPPIRMADDVRGDDVRGDDVRGDDALLSPDSPIMGCLPPISGLPISLDGSDGRAWREAELQSSAGRLRRRHACLATLPPRLSPPLADHSRD